MSFDRLAVLGLLLTAPFAASACNFTYEQDQLIRKAASYGKPYNYQKTLAAIIVQESFVGRHIVRINPQDGKHGSYGVAHILLETVMYFEQVKSSWDAKANIAPRLMADDNYAFELAVRKLDSVHNGDWMRTWSRYNGGSMKYANKIKGHIKKLERCGYFKG